MPYKIKSFFLSFILIVVLPNITFVIAATYLSLSRPYINFDYLIAVLLVYTSFRFLGIIVFIVFFTLDMLALSGQVLLFIRLDSFLYLAKFLPQTSSIYQVGALAIIILLIASIILLWQTPRFTKQIHMLALFNVALIFYAVNAYSSTDTQEKIWRVQRSPIVASQSIFLFDKRSDGFLQNFNEDAPALSDIKVVGASDSWFSNSVHNEKLMLITVESWGVPNNPKIQNALLSPLLKLKVQFKNMSKGTLKFSGPTVAAELRELCQLAPLNYNFKKTETGFENCLPNRLKQAGYNTYALHGAAGVMYDRIYWYPRAGFASSTFFETQKWPRRCYSFPGACDIDMLAIANKAFSGSNPTFLYWLTLNSHSIYDPRDIIIDVFNCLEFDIPESSQTCRNLKLHAQFFFSLAAAIEQGDFHNVEIILVGDHDPVMTNPEEKMSFFVPNKVPWLKFTVNSTSLVATAIEQP